MFLPDRVIRLTGLRHIRQVRGLNSFAEALLRTPTIKRNTAKYRERLADLMMDWPWTCMWSLS
jgi:hypothetical protein